MNINCERDHEYWTIQRKHIGVLTYDENDFR